MVLPPDSSPSFLEGLDGWLLAEQRNSWCGKCSSF